MNKTAEFFHRKSVKITLIAILAVVLLMAGFCLYVCPWNNIARGVTVGDEAIGGMSKEKAYDTIELETKKNYTSLDTQKIILKDVTGATKELSGADIDLSFDYEKTIEEAHKIGRSGDFVNDCITLVKNVFVPWDAGYRYSLDSEKLAGLLYDFGVSINGEMKPFTVEYEKGYVKVSKGTAGQGRDIDSVVLASKDAISNGSFQVNVELTKSEPPEVFGKALVDYIYTAPADATYVVEDGVIKITDEVLGVSVSEEEVKEKIPALKNGETITLKIIAVSPEVTKKSLYNQLFSHTLGSHTSKYSASNKNRTANVTLAAKLIHGIVLAPGETFSYNKALGPRTVQRGFKEAPVYSNGESVTGIGGGICQVSSTLYSAVLYADLEVVERKNHSMTVDYMPKGQDATVSYGSIDFKFRNNTKNPIKINATASGGILSVKVIGTKPEVERVVKITNNIVEVIDKTTVDIPDETLASGETKTEDVGKIGYVVDTYKTVMENGVQVRKDYVGRSRYKMVPQKRRVGTKVAQAPAPTETPPPAEDVPVFSEDAEETVLAASPEASPTNEPVKTQEPEKTNEPLDARPEANPTEENE